MQLNVNTTLRTLFAAANLASGQTPPPSILTIDVANFVMYNGDISDVLAYAKNANKTPSKIGPGTGHGEFSVTTVLADIVAINGRPAKGLFAARTRVIAASPNPTAGTAIADVTRSGIREQIFELLQPDGTLIGNIVALGFDGGPPPPGAPYAQRGGNWAIVGVRALFSVRVAKWVEPEGSPACVQPRWRKIP